MKQWLINILLVGTQFCRRCKILSVQMIVVFKVISKKTLIILPVLSSLFWYFHFIVFLFLFLNLFLEKELPFLWYILLLFIDLLNLNGNYNGNFANFFRHPPKLIDSDLASYISIIFSKCEKIYKCHIFYCDQLVENWIKCWPACEPFASHVTLSMP